MKAQVPIPFFPPADISHHSGRGYVVEKFNFILPLPLNLRQGQKFSENPRIHSPKDSLH